MTPLLVPAPEQRHALDMPTATAPPDKQMIQFLVFFPERKSFLHKPRDVTDRHGPIMRLVFPVLLLFFTAFRFLAGGRVVCHLLQRAIGFFNAQLPQLFG